MKKIDTKIRIVLFFLSFVILLLSFVYLGTILGFSENVIQNLFLGGAFLSLLFGIFVAMNYYSLIGLGFYYSLFVVGYIVEIHLELTLWTCIIICVATGFAINFFGFKD